MRRIIMGFICTGLVMSPLWGVGAAWAQERTDTVTVAERGEITRGYLQDQVVGVKPLVGVIAFKDQDVSRDNTARMAYGLEIDWNAAPLFGETAMRNIFLGPTVGFVFSHLGEPTSNFFGTSADVRSERGGPGANLIVVPTNLKLGYNLSESFRLSAHGGANIIYRSIASSINLGSGSDSSGSLWKYYPNVGADFEFGLGKSSALSLRPDWTFAPNDDMFMGTVALVIGMG